MARRKKYKLPGTFIAIGKDMLLRCKEWKELGTAAKLFYIYIRAKHNSKNNGNIKLYYSELEGIQGISSPSTISKAIKELETKGWIDRTKCGGIYRYNNEYKLTGKYDNYIINKWAA